MIGDSQYNHAAIRNLLLAAFTADTLRRFCHDRPHLRPVVDRFGLSHGLDDMVDEVITFCETRLVWAELLAEVKQENERQYARFAPDLYQAPAGDSAGTPIAVRVAPPVPPTVQAHAAQPARVFVSYKRHAPRDRRLAYTLHDRLAGQGHHVFIDATMRAGVRWLEEIDRQIQDSDLLVVLLSRESADSEMVQAEVRRAYDYYREAGKPRIVPVRVAYEGRLPYSIDAFLNPMQYIIWQGEGDDERVGGEIAAAIEGRLADRPPVRALDRPALSEDGRPSPAPDVADQAPLPVFDPRFLEELEAPGGAVKLSDRLYVERDEDARLKREIVKAGTTTTIRAARQTGKSSLLVRGVHHARQAGARVVYLDMQGGGGEYLAAPDLLLRTMAEQIVRQLRLDRTEVEKMWHGALGPQEKLTYLLEDYVLPQTEGQIVLALDEADRLLHTDYYQDFFSLVRSWHNNRAYHDLWNRLNLVMVVSTEPYLLIRDVNQSPFNVGLRLYLRDLSEAQVGDLNRRHGSPVGDADMASFMELLNGQPYLTRKALYTLVTDQIGWAGLVRVAAADQGPFYDHLRHHYWLLHEAPELQAALRQVLREERCSDQVALFRLLQAGLVKGSGDVCKCRCDLYRIYFRDKL